MAPALIVAVGLVAAAWVVARADLTPPPVPAPALQPLLLTPGRVIPGVTYAIKHRPFGPLECDDHLTTAGEGMPVLPPGPPPAPTADDTAEIVLGDIPDLSAIEAPALPAPMFVDLDPITGEISVTTGGTPCLRP